MRSKTPVREGTTGFVPGDHRPWWFGSVAVARPARRAALAGAAWLCSAILPVTAAAQGTPYLVKDINQIGTNTDAGAITVVGGLLMYAGRDDAGGTELWSSDGTAAGTHRVADIRPGADGSLPEGLVDADGLTFFAADDGVHGPELWRSDGSADGTSLVKDARPGADGSRPQMLTWCPGAGLLFFLADDGEHGTELWASDGTASGTRLVRDIAPGESDANIGTIVAAGDHVLFSTWDEAAGTALWSSDGTAQGTFLVKRFRPGPDWSDVAELTYWPELQRATFTADDGVHGYEPWVSDGTPDGTLPLGDLNPDGDSWASQAVAHGGALYFLAESPTGLGRLWRTDGTAGGTQPVATPFDQANGERGSLSDLAVLGDLLVFFAQPYGGNYELWRSDGSAPGTARVVRFPDHTQPYGVVVASARTLFIGYAWGPDGTGYELWTSDGSADGTHIVKDIFPGPVGSDPKDLVVLAGTAFFTAHDNSSHGRVLWRSDGTAAGTSPVVENEAEGPDAGALYDDLVPLGDKLIFAAYDTLGSSRLWQSDGTADGTLPLAATETLLDAQQPQALNGQLVFWADDGVHGREPWRTDASAAGTMLLADIYPGPPQSYAGETARVGDTLFFTVSPDDFDDGFWELWATDGTAPGTRLVKRIDTAPEGGEPTDLTPLGGAIYFSAADPEHGRELWRSDGTSEGTVLVKDIAPGTRGSGPQDMTQLDERIYFFANDRVHGRELWLTDGSEAGTSMILDVNPGPRGLVQEGYQVPHIALGKTLYFAADDGVHGPELWRTRGTAESTVLVKDIAPGDAAGAPWSFAVVGRRLMFAATAPAGSVGLWTSDGTGDGTVLVSDACRSPSQLTNVNGVLYFRAWDDDHGEELWKSDGSAAGTARVMDILPGGGSSYPQHLVNLHGQLFFVADDGRTGRELWGLTCGNAVVEADEECDDGARNGTSESCCRGDCRLRPASAPGASCVPGEDGLLLTRVEIRPSSSPPAHDGAVRARGIVFTASTAMLLDPSRALEISVADGVGTRASVRWPAGQCRPTRGAGLRCSDPAARHVAVFAAKESAATGTTYRVRIILHDVQTVQALSAPARVVLRQRPGLDRRGTIAACAITADGMLACNPADAS